MKIKGKGFQHCVKYEFQPRKVSTALVKSTGWGFFLLLKIFSNLSGYNISPFMSGLFVVVGRTGAFSA